MRIAQLNTTYPGGGSGRIAHSLYEVVKANGFESEMVLSHYAGEEDFNVIGRESSRPIWEKQVGLALRGVVDSASRFPLLGKNSDAKRKLKALRAELREPTMWLNHLLGRENWDYQGCWDWMENQQALPEVVHIHDLHGGYYFDLRMLPELSRRTRVVLTLHNEAPLTGLCHYSLDCDRWKNGCGSCPHLDMYPVRRDRTAKNLQDKAAIYRQSEIYVSAPSAWLLNRVESSVLQYAVKETKVIHNGIDLKVFRPGDQREARDQLGLPQDKKMLLFVGNKTRSAKWKGFGMVERAYRKVLAEYGSENLMFVAVGEGGQDGKPEWIDDIHYVPLIKDLTRLTTYYQAADLFVHGAVADNFPTTLLEAAACGLPVVSSNVGGIPEIVLEGETGLLVDYGDSAAMADRMLQILRDDSLHARLVSAALARGATFDQNVMGDQYIEWYQQIIGSDQTP